VQRPRAAHAQQCRESKSCKTGKGSSSYINDHRSNPQTPQRIPNEQQCTTGRIQTVCLQNTNPNGHAVALWSPSIIPNMGSGWGRRNNIIRLFIHQGSDQQWFNYCFLIDTASVTNQKTRASLEVEIKLISAKTHHEGKTAGVFIEREIKCGDKKWSKKEIANKDINKISFGQQGTRTNNSNQNQIKNQQIFSQKVPTSRFAILRTIQIGAPNVWICYEKVGGALRVRECVGTTGDREYMETPRRIQKQENNHGVNLSSKNVSYSMPRHTVFFVVYFQSQ